MGLRKVIQASRGKRSAAPPALPPAKPAGAGRSASTLIEAPQKPGSHPLDPHAFPDGGGSGGAEAFSRKQLRK